VPLAKGFTLRTITLIILTTASIISAQPTFEYLGLQDKPISCMGTWEGIIAVGTQGEGVYYQWHHDLPDSSWVSAGLTDKDITAIYPHKSGPLGWSMGVGISPGEGDSSFIYCGFMGSNFFPNSMGISDSLVERVFYLDGFPDMTICGEKYAATGNVLYRQLFGDSLWQPVYESLGMEGSGVIYVRAADNLGGLVLAGGSEGFTGILLIKSYDYGDSWDYIYPPGSVVAFDFSLDDSESDFGAIFVSHHYQISRSLNGGEDWEIIFNNGWYHFNSIVIDPVSSIVFAGGGNGLDSSSAILIYSADLGASWGEIDLPSPGPILDLAVTQDGYVIAATPQSGVFRASTSQLSIEDVKKPGTYSLQQNYPNPFNPATTIGYKLPIASAVNLTVYDIAGRQIATLTDSPQPAGFYDVRWNGTDDSGNPVSTGVYFSRLQAGEYVKTIKMVLLR